MRRSANKRRFRWDYTLACVVAVIGIAIVFVPPQTVRTATLWLVLLFGLGVYPVLHIAEWVVQVKRKWVADLVGIAILAVIVVGFGKSVWPHGHRHIFGEAERHAFEQPLSAQTSPREEIQLACPQADENTCVYAAQFINMFREAGWRVQGNQVQRVTLAAPFAGVVLFKHSDGKPDPNNWRSGVWTRLSPSLESVYQAFVDVGIEPDSASRADIPEEVMTVYFGSEKPDEAERTQLTTTVETVRRYRREGKLPKPQ